MFVQKREKLANETNFLTFFLCIDQNTNILSYSLILLLMSDDPAALGSRFCIIGMLVCPALHPHPNNEEGAELQ